MPYGRKRRRSYQTRTKRRRQYRPRRAYTALANPPTTYSAQKIGLANGMKVNLQWTVGQTYTGSGLETYVFRLNSPYDPNYTGVGNQPAQWDELMAIYSRCTVVASRILVDIFNESQSALYVALLPLANTVSAPTWDQAMMMNGCKYKLVAPFNSGTPVGKLVHYQSIKGLMQIDPTTDTDYACSASDNPNVGAYWHLLIRNSNTAVTNDVYIRIHITYYCVFKDLIPVTFS